MIKRHLVIACLTLGLAVVASSCRAPEEETQASSANSNSANAQPAAAEPSADAHPHPHPEPPPPSQAAADPQPPMKQIVPAPPPIPGGPAGKLVVPIKRIDFGLQPKNKSLTRTISVRNEGKAELQIAAVEPS